MLEQTFNELEHSLVYVIAALEIYFTTRDSLLCLLVLVPWCGGVLAVMWLVKHFVLTFKVICMVLTAFKAVDCSRCENQILTSL